MVINHSSEKMKRYPGIGVGKMSCRRMKIEVPISPTHSVPLWITPISRATRYNLAVVQNTLKFTLSAALSRLTAVRVRARGFRVTVSF